MGGTILPPTQREISSTFNPMRKLTSSLFPFDAGVVAVSAMACINSIKSERDNYKKEEIQRRVLEVRKKWWGKKYQISREEAEQEVDALEWQWDGDFLDWVCHRELDLQRAYEIMSAVRLEEEGATVFLSAEDAALVNAYRKQDAN